ncbi:MAG: endonuclease MutS2 [Bacteriovoracia bacterium]
MNSDLPSLEWQSLLRHYSVHCLSAPAKLAALEIAPSENRHEAEALLELTDQGLRALELGNFVFLSTLDSLEPVLERLERSSVLDGKELLHLSKLARISQELQAILGGKEGVLACAGLHARALSLPPLAPLTEALVRAIDDHGQVKDSASPALRSLRDQERRLHSEARERVEAVLQQAFRDGFLQEKFYDVRDGRYLIPVKSEFRNKVSGFVVESSATRATVFMEPAAVRDANDKIKQTQLQIEEEVYRILAELSAKLFPHAAEFAHAYETSVEIDLCLARASFARKYETIKGVSRPEFSDRFFLDGLYHPLLGFVLAPEKIIRNGFVLGPERRVLVISGPNTGGKTVLLKAVGLSSLMARAGFFLPCAGESKLPFLSKVLAQIGDSQNLELSLSSFSGSILHLKEILESVERGTLVLIDEILHATDPDEATALSRAILSELQSRGAYAIVTTHLNGLKASGESAFESASMEFDPEKLSPTYRLRMGVPGSSRALEIGLKLGLSSGLVNQARSFLSEEKVAEQSAVDKLEGQERELAAAKLELEAVKKNLEEEQARYAKLNSDLAAYKKRFRDEALELVKEAERSAMAEVDRTITAYKKRLPSVQEKQEAAVAARAETEKLKESFEAVHQMVDEVAPAQPPPKTIPIEHEEEAVSFRKNGPVRLLTMRTEGVLLSDPALKEKQAEVMVGNLRMKVKWDQIEPRAESRAPSSPRTANRQRPTEDFSLPTELNLIGRTVDEAMDQVATYIDRASRSGKAFVRIVHGHGSGALKKAVRDFLKKTKYELKYRPGTLQEGGEGCTVVEFYGV